MSTNSSGSKIQTTIAGIPIIVAVLYWFGSSFYMGFAKAFNLEGSQFPLAVDQNLFYGFYALIGLSAKQIWYFIIAALLSMVVSTMAIYLSSVERLRTLTARLIQFLRGKGNTTPQPQLHPAIAWLAKFSTGMMVVGCSALILIFLIALVGWSASQLGRESAKTTQTNIKEGKQLPVDIFLVGQKDPIKGFSLMCNATHCAYIVDKDVVIYPLSSIEKTISHGVSVNLSSVR